MEQVKKKRKTIIKTCTFCRRRKLKCDKKRPRCTSCVTRNLSECVYLDDSSNNSPPTSNTSATQDNTISAASATSYSSDTSPLSSTLANNDGGFDNNSDLFNNRSNGTIPSSFNQAGMIILNKNEGNNERHQNMPCFPTNPNSLKQPLSNPLASQYYLLMKDSGRLYCYGPTSTRCFTRICHQRFLYSTNWAAVKAVRKKWKKKHNFSILKSLKTLEQPYMPNSRCLTDEVCNILPSFEDILKYIDVFFDNSEIYNYNTILDKNKVLNDFFKSFIPSTSIENGKRKVIHMKFDKKMNCYKPGVILMILVLTKYFSAIPPQLEKFFIMLDGFTNNKVFYIERAQFLLLQILHRGLYGSHAGDNSSLIDLVTTLCKACTTLGLNHDIDYLFKGKENIVGRIDTLKDLWIWTLYYDYSVAFETGNPMNITQEYFFDFSGALCDRSNTFIGLMKRYLKIVRPMFRRIIDRNVVPILIQDEEILLTFIETEFPDISKYTDEKEIYDVDLNQIRILCSALSMLVCNYVLRCSVFGEETLYLKVGFTKATNIAFHISTNLVSRCFSLDEAKYPEMIQPTCNELPPFIALALNFTGLLLTRSLISFLTVASLKLFSISNPPVFLIWDESRSKLKLDTLRANHEDFSIQDAFDTFCEIFDRWACPRDPKIHLLMRRSYTFVISTTFQRLGRKMVSQIIKNRKQFEKNWIDENLKGLEAAFGVDYLATLNSNAEAAGNTINIKEYQKSVNEIIEKTAKEEISKIDDNMNQGLDYVTVSVTNKDNAKENIPSRHSSFSGQESNLKSLTNGNSSKPFNKQYLNSLYNDFWETYNNGFESILGNNDSTEGNDNNGDFSIFDDLSLF